MNITVDWCVTPYSLVDTYRCFGKATCVHREGRRYLVGFFDTFGVKYRRAGVFIFCVVKSLNQVSVMIL